jgi:hypothetical protein
MAAPNRRFANERHPFLKVAAAVVALATFASIWTAFSSAYASDSAANADPESFVAVSAVDSTAQPPVTANETPAAGSATPSAASSAGSAPPPTVAPSTGSQRGSSIAPVQRRSRGS